MVTQNDVGSSEKRGKLFCNADVCAREFAGYVFISPEGFAEFPKEVEEEVCAVCDKVFRGGGIW